MLINEKMRVKFWDQNLPSRVFDFGELSQEDWYVRRLDDAIMKNSDLIFFLVAVVETTDVFEPEIDFNPIAWTTEDGLRHSHTPECPQGCYGQFDDCVYKKE